MGLFGGNKEEADSDKGASETQKAIAGPNETVKVTGASATTRDPALGD